MGFSSAFRPPRYAVVAGATIARGSGADGGGGGGGIRLPSAGVIRKFPRNSCHALARSTLGHHRIDCDLRTHRRGSAARRSQPEAHRPRRTTCTQMGVSAGVDCRFHGRVMNWFDRSISGTSDGDDGTSLAPTPAAAAAAFGVQASMAWPASQAELRSSRQAQERFLFCRSRHCRCRGEALQPAGSGCANKL